ncbi:MAG: hypothetical protein R6W67_12405, partial [Bacteroidales bacterium]
SGHPMEVRRNGEAICGNRSPYERKKALPLKRKGFFLYGVAGSSCKSHLMKKASIQTKPLAAIFSLRR